jgi:hypothetical protein
VPSRIYKAIEDPKTGEVRIVEVTDDSRRASTGMHYTRRHSGSQRLTSGDMDDIKARSRDRAERRDVIMRERIGNGGTWKP